MSYSLLEKFLSEVQVSTSLDEAKAFGKAARMALDETTRRSLSIEDAGGDKIAVIKELRNIFGYGLKESKDKAETPNYLLGSFYYDEALRIKTRMESVGCKVRMV